MPIHPDSSSRGKPSPSLKGPGRGAGTGPQHPCGGDDSGRNADTSQTMADRMKEHLLPCLPLVEPPWEARGHRAQTREATGLCLQVRRAGRERGTADPREERGITNTRRSGRLLTGGSTQSSHG